MLDPQTIQALAATHDIQDFMAALLWQRRHNDLNGEVVARDLMANPDLWYSFWISTMMMTTPKYWDVQTWQFLLMLTQMAESMIYRRQCNDDRQIRYFSDTLYIMTEDLDTKIAPLVDFGEKWQADEVSVLTRKGVTGVKGIGEDDRDEFDFSEKVRKKLAECIPQGIKLRDAAIVSYWWD